MVEADALILHLNALQEALQPEGDTCFAGLINKIELVCKSLSVPVIAKEVGWGFSSEDIRLLIDAGVSAIDVAGAGGTSWSQVEMHRTKDENQALIAKSFINWGIPTSESILNVKRINQHLPIIASGGLNSGLDIAKCISLGAMLGGIANAFLKTAVISADTTIQSIRKTHSISGLELSDLA